MGIAMSIDLFTGTRCSALGLALSTLLLLSGCAPATLDDDGRIVRATLGVLAAARAAGSPPLCVDNRTRGEPLAIFRTMRAATTEHDLRWREPAAFQARPRISGRALFEDAIGRNRLRIDEPQSVGAILPANDQRRLDTAATTMAILGDSGSATFGKAAASPGTRPRWWLANRVGPGCDRVYVLSRIVHDARIGFVTVTADHWGTTYAVERWGDDWRVAAQWDSWLY